MVRRAVIVMVRWALIVLVSLAAGVVAFALLGRHELGPPRPAGTVCDFQHDPGSGKSDEGVVERRGWLVPHEACVHATDGEYSEPLSLGPFAGCVLASSLVGLALIAWELSRPRARRASEAGGTPTQ